MIDNSQTSELAQQLTMLDTSQALERMGGDMDLLREVAALFLDDAPNMMQAVTDAVARANAKDIERAAHSMKGCVANFGAKPAFDAALALEMAGRQNNLAEAGPLLARLEEAIGRLKPELSALVNR